MQIEPVDRPADEIAVKIESEARTQIAEDAAPKDDSDGDFSFDDLKELAEEKWDELEKSVIANIADEIEIGIAGKTVEMIVYKKM